MALTQTPKDHYLDPIVLSLLLVLRVKKPDWYAGLLDGSMAPRELMETLRQLPTAREFSASRVSTVLEAYLIAGDVMRERGKHVLKDLQALANAQPETVEGVHARKLVEMQQHVSDGWDRDFSIKHVANKVDLAAKLGNDY